MIRKRFYSAVMLSAAFLLSLTTACIKENTEDCVGSRICFRYAFGTQEKDYLDRIGDIRLYIFDENSVLSEVIRVDDQQLMRGYVDVDLEPGSYTVSAWAGSSENLFGNGFLDAEMTDPATGTYTTPVGIGATTLSNFRMMLACNAAQAGVFGDIVPATEPFDDLYFADLENIEVKRGTSREYTLNFIQDTKTIRVTVDGLANLGTVVRSSSQPLSVCVVGKNDRYDYRNGIDGYARKVCYEKPFASVSSDAVHADIRTLRLDIARHASDPVYLYLSETASGNLLMPPVDVIAAILKAKDAQGNLIVQNQTDLDKLEEFPFVFHIDANLGVSVSIFGYTVVHSELELQ